jgi:CheY-like chemotaxis protein
MGTLAGGIAHDLNNVLTPILTIAQLLRLTQKNLDATGKERLSLLEEGAKRGAGMVKQILTFARGSQGEQTVVDLIATLQEVVDMIQRSFPKAIEIRPDFLRSSWSGDSPMKVFADPTHLSQVFMNLCINARDAMPDGGILTIAVESQSVDAGIPQTHPDSQAGEYWTITITDTGTGMTPEVRDRMFEPFFTTKEIGEGTGLGLSTVLGIVKSHGGFLQVASEVGQGTQISVYLPVAESSLPRASQPDQPFYGQGELILVVDDDVSVQKSMRSLLESHHYTTLVANDGLEASQRYRRYQDDIGLVILDVMMPNMDGISLVQSLKSINSTIKIIAVSGLPTNREPVLAAGADAFLAKPYSFESLLEKVYELVNTPHH